MGLARLLYSPQGMNIALSFLEKQLRFQYTEEQRERVWLKFVARADAHERKYIRVFRKMFDRQRAEVLSRMPRKNYKATQMDIEQWMFDKPKWNVRFAEAGQLLLPMTIEEAGQAELETLIVGVDFNVSDPRVGQFIDKRKIKLRQVNDTTELAIRRQLTEGINLGEGIPELRKRVQGVFADASRNRATMIARSETIRASNFAAEQAYIQSGVVEGKEWLTAKDERTCPWCSDMNGKTMALGGNFFALGERMTVDGRTMKFDYDSVQYPPLHVQCRCTLIPVMREIQIKTAQEIREDIIEYAEINELELHRMEAEIDDLLAKQIRAEAAGNRADSFMFETQAEDVREEVMRFKSQMRNRILEYIDAGQKTESSINLMYIGDFTYHQQARMQPAIEAIEKLIKNVNPQIDNILVTKTAKTRVYFQGNTMYVPHHSAFYSDSPSQILHATGHWLEKNDPGFAEKMKAFYKSRTTGERAKKLGGRYAKDEAFRKDKFIDPYMGKVYKTGQTEIASTGLSYLYKDPLTLARGDPEYFDFLVNTLKGIE